MTIDVKIIYIKLRLENNIIFILNFYMNIDRMICIQIKADSLHMRVCVYIFILNIPNDNVNRNTSNLTRKYY